MRTISIRQPWAHFIVSGKKDIENRTWITKYRGPILIHAGVNVGMNQDDLDEFCEEMHLPVPDLKTLQRGGIVGYATIVDCVEEHPSRWFGGPYGFVLENAGEVEFYPMKGKLGLWESDLEFV